VGKEVKDWFESLKEFEQDLQAMTLWRAFVPMFGNLLSPCHMPGIIFGVSDG